MNRLSLYGLNMQKRLNKVKDIVDQQLILNNEKVAESLQELADAGGKMVRPALFLFFADFGDNKDEDKLLKIAASLEILHMATLVHDDVIDDSPLRRSVITVQSRYGKDVAVYAGDFLFTRFFQLLIETMNGTEYMEVNANAMQNVLTGELDQMHNRFNLNETVEEYLRETEGKTAELFVLAAVQGAYFGDADEKIHKIAQKLGKKIGIVFQIYDDILDYTSSKEELRKPVMEDLSEGIYTLPLLMALKSHRQELTNILEANRELTVEQAKQVTKMVNEFGGVEQAKELAKEYSDETLDLLEQLPKGTASKELKQLVRGLVDRKF